MPETFIAFLYSIGIGDGRRLMMAEWREMMEELGLGNPRTLIATGNAVFESDVADVRAIEARLERAFEKRFGRHVDCIVNPAALFRQFVEENPFPNESKKDGAQVMVRVMREPLGESIEGDLKRYLVQGERVKIVRGHLWVHFKGKANESRLMPVIGSKRLGIGTVRNWNTVRRLHEMLAGESK